MKIKNYFKKQDKTRLFSFIALLFALFLCSLIENKQLIDTQNSNPIMLDDVDIPQPGAIVTDNMSLVNWFDNLETGANWNVQANHSEARRSLQNGIFRIEGAGLDTTSGSIYAIYTVDLSDTYSITDALFEIYVQANTAIGGDVALAVYAGTTVGSQPELIYNWATLPSSWTTLSVKLSSGNINTSKPFYLRIVGSVERDNDWIEIDWVQLRSFNSSLTYNNSISGTDNFIANLTLEDSIYMVNRTLSTIRLYYNISGSQVTPSSPSIAATGSYPNYQFSLSPSIFTQNATTIYFMYGMRNNGTNIRNYTSQVYNFSFYDNVKPSIDSVVFNATPQYNQQVNITVNLSDLGGTRLKEVRLYYRVGSGALSLVEYEGRQDFIIPTHTNSYTHNFTIAGSLISVDPSRPFRFFIQAFDKSNNQNISIEYQIQGTDYIAPTATFVSMQGNQSNYIRYWENVSITYSITKNWDSLGLNFIQFRWKQGAAPANNNDFTGNFTLNVYAEKNYVAVFDITARLGSDFLMNTQYYYWVFVQDISNNTQTTYSENRNFRIQDIFAPEITENPNNTMNGGYLDDYILEFLVLERNGTYLSSSGLNASNVTLEYTINQNFIVPNIQTKAALREGNTWRYIFLNATLNEGDVLRYRFNASDLVGNYYSTGIRVINITDIYKPSITFQSSLSNITLLRTEYDALIVISASDELNKPIKNANISIRFGSSGSYESGIIQPSSSNSSNLFYFLLSKTFLAPYANLRMFYIIRAIDFTGNYREHSGEQFLVRQDIPIFISASFNGVSSININAKTAQFNFKTSSNSLMYLYINDSRQNAEPFVGTGIEEDITFASEGFWEIKVVYYTEIWSRVYYVDWTAPTKPENVRFNITNKNITLSWSSVPTTQSYDVHRYQIHRSNSEDFVPHQSNMIALIDGTEYLDSVEEEGVYYYRIVVIDRAGNLSPASDLIKVDTINPTGANLGGIIITSFAIVGGVVGIVLVMYKRKHSYGTFKEPKAPKAPKVKVKKGKRGDPFAMLEEKGSKADTLRSDPNNPVVSNGVMGTTAAAASRNALYTKSTATVHTDDGWGTKSNVDEGWGTPITPINASQSTKPELAPLKVPEGAEVIDGIPSSYKWSDEMKELYKDAKDFLELENKQSAIESLEILVRKAEPRNDEHTRAWAKAEIERIYREH